MQHERLVDDLDNNLHDHCAHISHCFHNVNNIKIEMLRWWNIDSDEASEMAREVRNNYAVRDDVVRQSLRHDAIVTLCAILEDNNSKNLNEIPQKFGSGPLGIIIAKIYKPLWLDYSSFHKDEFLQLKVNRNNLVAHMFKTHHINNVLSYGGERVPKSHDDQVPDNPKPIHNIIVNSDICGNMNLFNDSSLLYIQGLFNLLGFAQVPEIKEQMEAHFEKHLTDFRAQHPLV